MSNKKYYWLKLHNDFFDDLTIKMIEEMDNGILYTNFLLKLYLKSLKTEGKLLFREAVPYDEKMLSVLTGVNVDIVRSACKVFLQFGMMERWDDGTLYISEVQKMIGSETESAKRVRKHREQKVLQCNSDVIKSNTEIELEIELEIEKDNTPKSPKGKVDFSEYDYFPNLKSACEDYSDHIKALGKGYKKTERAWDLFKMNINSIIESHDEEVAITQIHSAIEGNWKKVYPPKEKPKYANGGVFQDAERIVL